MHVRHLDHRVILVSSAALLVVALLAANSIETLLGVKHDAKVQVRDARQAALNADFDTALVRAAGESASFAIMRREGYREEAEEAVTRAHAALDDLRASLGDKPSVNGLEGKHLAFIVRQREVLASVEHGFAAAQKLKPGADQAMLQRVLDEVYAYEPAAEQLRKEVSAHRKSEYAANAHALQTHAQKTINAFIVNFAVLVLLIGSALFFTRRHIVFPIKRLAAAATVVAQGNLNRRVAVKGTDEIATLQIAFNAMVDELRRQHEILIRQNKDLALAMTELQKTEERYRLLVENAPDGTFVSRDGRFVYFNPALVKFLGVAQAASLLGQSVFDYVHPDCKDAVRDRMHRVMEDRQAITCEEQFVRSDGTPRDAECAATPCTYDGQPAIQVMVRDITERKRIANELEESREQLRHFAASLDHAIEEERGRIARELHDELGQVFIALTMDLDLLDGMLAEHAPGDDFGAVGDKIEGMSQMINDSIGVVRRIASDLRPPLLDNLGLDAAIEAYAQQFSKRTGIPCALEVGPQTYPTGHIATAVFRICQEALTNIIRHAAATQVWIHLNHGLDGLRLEIKDNGHGISASQAANPLSVGLTGMRERARLLAGTLTISGLPFKGTSVSLWVPSPPQ